MSTTTDSARVTTDGSDIVITRQFAAPAQLVYDAMTRPEHVRQWWGAGHGTMTTCEVDLRVGGRWHFAQVTPDGHEVSFSGEYLELDPPGRMVHTEKFDAMPDSEPSTIVTTLTEQDGVTTLHAVCTYDSPQTVEAVVGSGMESGLQSSYNAIDDLLARLKNA
ncbi:SRPBCC family protein [Phycicoccus sp. M110.8]|uniref:SRPBCC family protein n=1 Tax=Phycicoccus sp. M110.8 TaxID=3075433 RepID=UPI0028FD5EE4|nr:SRPBCC family protein [Phycicoccus sp. M110.8]MDU0312427.1 SRPBCC family protein [Phycicoccus sp. M110.8]